VLSKLSFRQHCAFPSKNIFCVRFILRSPKCRCISETFPPPPGISNINQYNDWTLTGYNALTGNTELNRLELVSNGVNGGTALNLNEHTLSIGKRGIIVRDWMNPRILGQGRLTSNQSFLDIYMLAETKPDFAFYIDSVISDHSNHKVGMRVLGSFYKQTGIILTGTNSNTFTGDLEVSGSDKYVALSKLNGATAIQGNISLGSNTILAIWRSNQIADSSSLRIENAALVFAGWEWDIEEKFHQAIIKGQGVLFFGHDRKEDSRRSFFLDDLIIYDDSLLKVDGWKEGRDWILVKKTSENLDDALRKIWFQGYDPNAVHLEEYNEEYWAISGAPEPSTYGAIFASGVLGLVSLRKRRRAAGLLAFDVSVSDSALPSPTLIEFTQPLRC